MSFSNSYECGGDISRGPPLSSSTLLVFSGVAGEAWAGKCEAAS